VSSIPPRQDSIECPNCKNPILIGSTWCPHCGAGKPHDNRQLTHPKRYTFGWVWFLFSFLIVPLGACGSCFLSYDIAGYALFIMAGSVVVGFLLLIINAIRGPQSP